VGYSEMFLNSISVFYCYKYIDDDFRKSVTIIAGLVFSSAFVYYMDLKNLSEFNPFDSKVSGTNL
jgi:hypothetical protein